LLERKGLLSAVRRYVEGFTERSGIGVNLDLGEVGPLPPPIELALFRVVQESLTNVYRHASGATASIRLTNALQTVTLEIHDQGRGFREDLRPENETVSPRTLGVGIQGMRERIGQLGGTFEVVFTETGTTVRVCVTVPETTHETSPHPDRR
jgi:signal transduction histidine kinase